MKTAHRIRTVWEANPELKLGDIQLDDFKALNDAAAEIAEEYLKLKVQLNGLKNSRDDKVEELSRVITRFRSGVRGHYGLDSVQYAQSGGIRTSDRKRPKRKSKTAGV